MDTPQKDENLPEDLMQRWRRYKCLVCGFVYEGSKRPNKCPKCGNTDMDKFVEVD